MRIKFPVELWPANHVCQSLNQSEVVDIVTVFTFVFLNLTKECAMENVRKSLKLLTELI